MANEIEAKDDQQPTMISLQSEGRGAVYRTLHVERQVRIYPVEESELRSLGLLSTAVTLCSSIAMSAVTYLLSVLWDMSISDGEKVQRAGYGNIAVSCLLIVVFGAIGVWAYRSRQSDLQKILSQTRAS